VTDSCGWGKGKRAGTITLSLIDDGHVEEDGRTVCPLDSHWPAGQVGPNQQGRIIDAANRSRSDEHLVGGVRAAKGKDASLRGAVAGSSVDRHPAGTIAVPAG
jgi:hypothetical protein